MSRILALIIFLIIYGSLYPWTFHWDPGMDPIALYGRSRPFLLNRFTLLDFVINVVLYIPLGAAAYLTLVRRGWRAFAGVATVLLGFALSASIEFVQVFQPARVSSLVDLFTNTLGSCAGVGVGMLLASRPAFARRHPQRRTRQADPVALGLLTVWVGFLTFPLFPVLGRTAFYAKVRILLSPFPFEWIGFLTAAVGWLIAGHLIAAEGIRRPALWLAASTLLVPAQLFILNRQPRAEMFAGACAGVLAWVLTRRLSWRTALLPGIVLGTIVLRGIAPFRFTGLNPFNWIPFASVLGGHWHQTALALLDKVFFYGAAVWSLRCAGVRPGTAVLATAVLVGALEAAQIRIAGRTADITDPVIVILLGLGFGAAYRSKPESR